MKAVIDIGTNTFHLLIARVAESAVDIQFKQTIAVKLGEGGGINKGEIIPSAYQRGLEAMELFRAAINKYPVETIKATATAAVRDAANGKDFIQEVYQLTQIKIDIIDGLKEAEYIYLGAKATGALSDEKALIMDIGGGSVEFILANRDQIFWKKSYRLGAARLLDRFYKNDPLEEDDKKLLEKHFDAHLADLFEETARHQPQRLIGTAGAFDSYKEMICARYQEDPSPIVYPLPHKLFLDLLTEIGVSTHKQRAGIPGLIPLRIDMILMASLLTSHVLERCPDIKACVSCAYSLKEGLLASD